MPKAVFAGGTGLLGRAATSYFGQAGWEVVILSRKPTTKQLGAYTDEIWDGETFGDWVKALDNTDLLVNFCGSTVLQRWTSKSKAEIISSRVLPTKILGKALKANENPPKVWINMSGAGIYGDCGSKLLTESSPVGSGFLAEVCEQWEAAMDEKDLPTTRRVKLRSGVVLSRQGGAFPSLVKGSKFFPTYFGSGVSYMPWIHIADFLKALEFICNSEIEGVVNVCSPEPVTSSELAHELGRALHRSFALTVPRFLISMAKGLVQFPDEAVLFSQRAIPEALQKAGFEFQFGSLSPALADLLRAIGQQTHA